MKPNSIRSVVLAALAATGLTMSSFAAGPGGDAVIGEVTYETLGEALALVQANQTVVLQRDCTLTTPFTNANAGVTLDFNGNKVTYGGAGYAFTVSGDGNSLTISNGTFDGVGEDGQFAKCTESAGLVIDRIVATQKKDDCIAYLDGNVCKILSSKLTGKTSYAVRASCVDGEIVDSEIIVPDLRRNADGQLVDVSGEVITSATSYNKFYTFVAIAVSAVGGTGLSSMKISGSSVVRGPYHAIYSFTPGGQLTIEGGTFSTVTNFQPVLVFDHPNVGCKKLYCTVTGGSFDGNIMAAGNGSNGDMQVRIQGGTFTNYRLLRIEKARVLEVTGGSFDADPNLNYSVGKATSVPTAAYVATATNKVAVITSSEGEPETWEIVDAAQVKAVAGANSTLTKLAVDGETIYDTENPVVGTIFPYSVSGMVVEGFEPVKMKVVVDTEMAATYTANDGYHFGEWAGEDSETTQTKSGMAVVDEILDLGGDNAEPPPPHEHEWSDWTTNVAATCTEDGYETRTCTAEYCTVPPAAETNVLQALDHDFGEWYVVKEPQAGIAGEERRDCQRENCDHYETHAIDPLPPVTDVVTTNAMPNASWGYTISGLGDDHRDVALVFTNAAETAMTWRVPQDVTGFEFLVVGGGGSGGSTPGSSGSAGGGGGAGGMATGIVATVTSGTQFAIEVGKGGAYSTSTTAGAHGKSGGDSKLAVGETPYVIAKGGGYGGGYPTKSTATVGGLGGSAGAAGGDLENTATAVGTATTLTDYDATLNLLNAACGVSGEVLGHNAGDTSASNVHGSGGGGAGAAGSKGSGANPKKGQPSAGKGGDGAVSFITGEEVYYAGGGGGGSSDNTSSATTGDDIVWGALGGKGGGGQGGSSNNASVGGGTQSGKDGLPNSGGGGGGQGYWTSKQGGNGGSGVVVIRYATGAAPAPAGPTVNGGATIAAAGDGAWAVTPNGETTITVSGLKAGDKVTVPVDTIESVAGVPAEDLILTVSGVEIDHQYFVGVMDGSATFNTELSEAAAPVIGEEGVEAPFVVGENAEVTIKAISGLYYQLLRGTEVTEIAEVVDEKVLNGVFLTITLTDGEKPETGAFYKVSVTKTPQKADE